jgi:hypothetical protein
LRKTIRPKNIIRRIRRSGHVTGVGEMRNAKKILLGKQRYNFGDLGVDGCILTNWDFQT